MKNLNNFIIEKLKLNKDIEDPKYAKFCNALGIEDSKAAKGLFKYYDKDKTEKDLDGYFDEGQLCSTCFDLLLMLSVLLIEDGNPAEYILKIGRRSYPGVHNPYDYSWFEEENSKGESVLEILQSLYSGNNSDWFQKYFNNFYDLVKACGDINDDTAWIFWDKMETPEEEWPKKEKEEWN